MRRLLLGLTTGLLAVSVYVALSTPAKATAQPRFSNKVPAKIYFGRAKRPAALPARVYGYYTRGCLSGGVVMPPDGPR